MDKQFETWKHGGKQYLAVNTGNNSVAVYDEDGENFGSWHDVAAFRERQRKGESCGLSLGRAVLRVIAHMGVQNV